MQEVVAIDEQENAGHGEPLDGVLQRTDRKSDDDFNFDEQGGVRFPFLLHQLQYERWEYYIPYIRNTQKDLNNGRVNSRPFYYIFIKTSSTTGTRPIETP